jgi:DNA polymerase III subunit epsilon
MHFLKLKKPLAFFDLETTGISISHDRIIEIGVVKAMPNGELITKTQRVHPEMPVPIESSLIHGIYDDDLKDAPTFKMVARTFTQFLDGCDLAGYNIIRFDVPMLVEEFLRVGVDFSIHGRRLVDAQKIFHLMEPRTLSAAYRFYCNREMINAHSAEADALATYHVLNAQVERYEGVEIKDDKGNVHIPIHNNVESLHDITAFRMVDLAGRMIYNAKNEIVWNFGKYKDQPVLATLEKDPGYYGWIMNGDFPQETKNRLTELKLQTSLFRK